jgi:hypothetical protein
MYKTLLNPKMQLPTTNLIKDVIMPLAQKTTQLLSQKTQILMQIKWTEGEANTDTEYSKLACETCEEAWIQIQPSYPQYQQVTLKATHPDINLTFLENTAIVAKAKIELKSTKSKNGFMPGSTIGKLDMNEPVIFCLRNDTNTIFNFRYAQYYNCIGESSYDMFQDRTPRPAINFHKMATPDTPLPYVEKEKGVWIPHYAECALRRIQEPKYKSWQDDLVKEILKEYIKNTSVNDFVEAKAKQLI